jgi:hypothetical protein
MARCGFFGRRISAEARLGEHFAGCRRERPNLAGLRRKRWLAALTLYASLSNLDLSATVKKHKTTPGMTVKFRSLFLNRF